MLFKILFIISLSCAYGFIQNRIIYKTIIYDNREFGSEYDLEMSDDEKKLHKEIKIEEEKNQYIKDVIKLQKYQTMYKLMKYLLDNNINKNEKISLLNIFKKEIINRDMKLDDF
jgi:glycyl-tRNA synthetase alpha subunit